MSHILVVDELLTDRTRISRLLTHELKCKVQTAEDGEVALDYIGTQRPDLVLTDLQMPGMGGLELLKSIRDEYPMIPVVLMTGKDSEDIAANGMKAGATSYVPKQRMVEELTTTVKRIIAATEDRVPPPHLMHRLEYSNSRFALSNDPAQVVSVVAHEQCMLRCLPLGIEIERIRIGLALEAALLNALFHGNMDTGRTNLRLTKERRNQLFRERWNQKPWCERQIHLTAEISRERARFVIRDGGEGFDTSCVDPQVTSLDSEGGRGLPLMYTIMDSVAFNSTGNEVTLIRNRAG